jgi:trehalose 6-phosphate synthase/phosphatase
MIIISRRVPPAVSRDEGKLFSRSDEATIVDGYAASRRRLLLLDYDGTLVPFVADPHAASPPARVLSLLEAVCAPPGNHVVMSSGRTKDDLGRWFGGLRMTLVAEHGAWVREPGSGVWEATTDLDTRWKDLVRPVLREYADRIEGAYLEEKDTTMAWHYRQVNPATAAETSQELARSLTRVVANLDLLVTNENGVVEVRSRTVSKGAFFRTHLAGEPWDFILALGDDETDETLFRVLPRGSFSVRIGLTASAARFHVESVEGALRLLERLRAGGPRKLAL